MTGQSIASQRTSDDGVNPFDNSRAYSIDGSTTSIHKPAPAVLQPTRHQRIASVMSSNDHRPSSDNNEILGVEQEHEYNEKDFIKAHKRQHPSIERRPQSYDPEKAAYTSPHTSQPALYTNDAMSTASSDALDNLEGLQARKALKILLYLSGPCVLLSFVTMLWGLVSLLLTILYQPLRLCAPRLSFRHQLCHLLAPTLNLHLRCIYAPRFAKPADDEEMYCGIRLLAVHLVAPLISLGDAIAAWVVAMYWSLARIVGDPSGVDKKDDGVEAVLGLTSWWQSFLMKGVNAY